MSGEEDVRARVCVLCILVVVDVAAVVVVVVVVIVAVVVVVVVVGGSGVCPVPSMAKPTGLYNVLTVVVGNMQRAVCNMKGT